MAEEGTGRQIARLEKGDSERTAMHADVMNEIIDRLNSIFALTVSPQTAGRFIWSDANGVLQIDAAAKFPTPEDETKTYVWFAEFVDSAWVFSWRETIDCDCGPAPIDGGNA